MKRGGGARVRERRIERTCRCDREKARETKCEGVCNGKRGSELERREEREKRREEKRGGLGRGTAG